ncbi:MAG TPA: hypothetical protein VKN18_25175 [Blastocatellia bacterium]|nr:hypothetical protein [Blastocatellia bacterium]
MKSTTLDGIEPLLAVLREYSALNEIRPAAFHLNGKDFIHFHEELEGIFADVRLSKGRIRMPVSTQQEQAEFLERIEDTLSSLTSHSQSKRIAKHHAK